MRRSLLSVLIIICSLGVQAQPEAFEAVKNVSSFQLALSPNNAAIKTISSDFVQTKSLALLSDKIKSKGKFFFQKEDKVRIEYTSPFSYLLVMNGGQVMVKD